MIYNFDTIINREQTQCVKYDLRSMFFGTEDVLPMWVADMDFATPDFVLNAIRQRTEHPVLGYSFRGDSYHQSLISWLKRRHRWQVEKEWIAFSPGIVPALNFCTLAFTRRRDKVIVQPPVYFPFFDAVTKHGRKLLYNPLVLKNGRYEMDFGNLEEHCKSGAKMLLLCNPHNPGGSAWRREDLEKLASICLKYNVLMVSDEIHSDLVNPGHSHTVLAGISPETAAATITLTAPSKTFNLAGMATASVIISNESLMRKYKKVVEALHVDLGNLFGNVAAEAAYTHGDEWLDQLLHYIHGNINYLSDFCKEHIKNIKVISPEATYMAWLDFRETGLSGDALRDFMIKTAGLGLNEGRQFGPGGDGFMRINLACPRSVLQHALENLKKAMDTLQ